MVSYLFYARITIIMIMIIIIMNIIMIIIKKHTPSVNSFFSNTPPPPPPPLFTFYFSRLEVGIQLSLGIRELQKQGFIKVLPNRHVLGQALPSSCFQ